MSDRFKHSRIDGPHVLLSSMVGGVAGRGADLV
jgi:hypothetical protein